MEVKAKKNASYLQTCYTLRKNIHRFSGKNGYLLSERKLCEQLSASRGTLRKALDELRVEGIIHTEKRRNYVTETSNNCDVGILMDCFKAAPYMPGPEVISGIMSEMERAGYNARLLVPREESSIPLMVKQYNLQGLLWLDPPESSLPTIVDMGRARQIKICCVLINHENKIDGPLQCNYVTLDRNFHGKQRAKYFIGRGHRRIAYLGNADATYCAFVEQMQTEGVKLSPHYRVEPDEVAERLPKLIRNEKITGILSNGGLAAKSMFESLSEMDVKALKLDIFLPYTRIINGLMEKFPRVRVSRFAALPEREYGSEAMKMLLRQITRNSDQPPVFLKPKYADCISDVEAGCNQKKIFVPSSISSCS